MTPLVRVALASSAAAFMLLLPFGVSGTYFVHVAIMTMIFAILAMGLDLVLGYCGQYSFAQGAFFGLGAYGSALLALHFGLPFIVTLPLAVAIAAVAGVLLGIPALRLSGHFLAITTIAFQIVVYLIMTQWYSLTHGMEGLTGIPPVGSLRILGITLASFDTPSGMYYLTLGLFAISALVAIRLARSRIGLEWLAIHDDELLARALGVDSMRRKVLAFAASAALAGAAGAVLAHYLRSIHPAEFSVWTSATILAMTIIGGRGTVLGPILGAVLLTLLPEVLRSADEFRLIIYGALMIIFVTFFPTGLVGLLSRRSA